MNEADHETDDEFRVTPEDLGEPEAATLFAHTGHDEPEKQSRGAPRRLADLAARALLGTTWNDETPEEP